MKRLFQTGHLIEAQSLKDLLDSDGIESAIFNETAAFSGQGAINAAGTPEVWVPDESYEQALQVKRDWLEQKNVA